jgi:hypothetical protein
MTASTSGNLKEAYLSGIRRACGMLHLGGCLKDFASDMKRRRRSARARTGDGRKEENELMPGISDVIHLGIESLKIRLHESFGLLPCRPMRGLFDPSEKQKLRAQATLVEYRQWKRAGDSAERCNLSRSLARRPTAVLDGLMADVVH